ncbi:putative capsid protein [Avon-Heathcote Estuary associated circular virus 7]|uniref:putative capsid protein n=1 Tax=Avon-Heathcote Estuary associated circular virus 7 TaxID=1618258 RepID=UPI0005CD771E|nr:putative capsid protein [Avon-Heathcote Estuary associated circular virus 7]AJP36370.1 putative capsid protein [Avon-Heathcote Estuary associated circular virus 7]
MVTLMASFRFLTFFLYSLCQRGNAHHPRHRYRIIVVMGELTDEKFRIGMEEGLANYYTPQKGAALVRAMFPPSHTWSWKARKWFYRTARMRMGHWLYLAAMFLDGALTPPQVWLILRSRAKTQQEVEEMTEAVKKLSLGYITKIQVWCTMQKREVPFWMPPAWYWKNEDQYWFRKDMIWNKFY